VASGILLDTSFFITLADPKRANHQTGRRYWKFFLEQQIPIYLSVIVVSEFYLKQELSPEILRACVVLPFNWNDAVKSAELDFTAYKGARSSRDALKDDIKIIAQARMPMSNTSSLMTRTPLQNMQRNAKARERSRVVALF
jgi:predicted nucleic acid-binding protein